HRAGLAVTDAKVVARNVKGIGGRAGKSQGGGARDADLDFAGGREGAIARDERGAAVENGVARPKSIGAGERDLARAIFGEGGGSRGAEIPREVEICRASALEGGVIRESQVRANVIAEPGGAGERAEIDHRIRAAVGHEVQAAAVAVEVDVRGAA